MAILARATDLPCAACWDAVAGGSTWAPSKKWSRGSVIYFRVTGHDTSSGITYATLLDPSIPCELGAALCERVLLDLQVNLRVSGQKPLMLPIGEAFVVFGTTAPVPYSKDTFRIHVPCPGPRAGIARMLGARLPTGLHDDDVFRVGEVFSGGMGGWTAATKHFHCFETAFGLDLDPDATMWCSLNHSGIVVPQCDCASFHLEDESKIPFFTCDVEDWSCTQYTIQRPCHIPSASFPCVSFSAMGNQQGVQVQPGKALLGVVQMIRVLQPLAVLFENVPGFRAPADFLKFREQLGMCGFKLCYVTTHDLSLMTCMSRKRWIAIAINTLYVPKGTAAEKWAHPLVRKSPAFDPAQHTSSEWSIDRLLQLSPTLHEKIAIGKYPQVGGAPPGSRAITKGQILPTFPASYRASAGFSEEYLQTKGLFAWLIVDCFSNTRWLSAIEAAAVMGFARDIQLPR